MAESCGKCLKSLKNVKVKVECVDCKVGLHAKCADLTAEEVNYLSDNSQLWRCAPCSKTRRKSMMLESKSEVSFDDILKLFTELKDELKRVESSIGTSLNSCQEELAETKAIVQKQGEDIKAWMEKVDELNSENVHLKKKVTELELRLDDADQYSRRNTVEIHGVPVEKGENIVSIVKLVGQALDYPLDESSIDACHRLRGRVGTGKPPGIIVKLVRRMDAEELLKKRRVKRNLSTHNLGMTARPAEVVYINESLTSARRKLLNAAREAKQEKKFTYLWVRGGRILVRKNEGDPVKVITTMDDLSHL